MRPLSNRRRCKAAVVLVLSSLRLFTLSEDQADVAGAVRLLSTLKYRFFSSSESRQNPCAAMGPRIGNVHTVIEAGDLPHCRRLLLGASQDGALLEGVAGVQAAELKKVQVEGGDSNLQLGTTSGNSTQMRALGRESTPASK